MTEVSDSYNMFGKIITFSRLGPSQVFFLSSAYPCRFVLICLLCPRLLGKTLNYSLNYFWKKTGGILEKIVNVHEYSPINTSHPFLS